MATASYLLTASHNGPGTCCAIRDWLAAPFWAHRVLGSGSRPISATGGVGVEGGGGAGVGDGTRLPFCISSRLQAPLRSGTSVWTRLARLYPGLASPTPTRQEQVCPPVLSPSLILPGDVWKAVSGLWFGVACGQGLHQAHREPVRNPPLEPSEHTPHTVSFTDVVSLTQTTSEDNHCFISVQTRQNYHLLVSTQLNDKFQRSSPTLGPQSTG